MQCDLIIPALNEASNIEALFDALKPLRGTVIRHIILADNGSTDDTADAAAARGAVVVHEPKRGYGAACLKAIRWIEQLDAPPDAVAFLDADLSDEPAILTTLLVPLEQGEADIVIGSRLKLAEPGALNPIQRFGNHLACLLLMLLTRRRHRDLGPFRVLRWETLQRLNMADQTWGWTVEMQGKAALLAIPTVEVDVPYHRRAHGRSKITGTFRGLVAAGAKITWTLIVLWWQYRVAGSRRPARHSPSGD